ncbi:hypothetical protein GC175_23865 [bacterium]|nr:hypothetical protein [bacterium]
MVVFLRNLHSGRGRLFAALLTAASFSLLLLLSTQASLLAQHGTPTEPRPLPPTVRVDGSITQPRLVIDGRTVLSGEGMHLGRPQLSPNGQRLAVDVIPSGTETAHLAQIHIYALDGELVDQLPGHSPRWVDDHQLGFETTTARGQYDLSTRRASYEPVPAPAPHTIPPGEWPVQYPATIRVAHHPNNNVEGCRHPSVTDWQIDVVPFEEYVARSVPAESPVSWSIEALKAQAVAARTYAWYKIRTGPTFTPEAFGRQPYDVTDWANFQMMCDNRFARSDQAVAETAGQYLSAQDDPNHAPIIAMYSARNSHPTKDNPAVNYLRGVPDLFQIGQTLFGHGYGLSQWGAKARADAGHNYRQILGHYYTGVYLQNVYDPAQPLGALLGLEPNGYLPPGGVRWHTLAPAMALTTEIDISATTPVRFTGRNGVWRNLLNVDEATPITFTLVISETQQDAITVQVDRTPPAPPTLTAPESAEIHRAAIQVTSADGDRSGLSNEDWIWQAEAFTATAGMDNTVSDAVADQSAARLAQAGIQTPGFWYGPYADNIPAGATYRALFRLRIDGNAAAITDSVQLHRPLARLDITDRFSTVRLGLRDLWLSDFPLEGGYTEIAVDFHLFEPPTGLEFRVQWFGNVDLAFDRVQVYRLLNGGVRNLDWPLTTGTDTPTVRAVSFDTAGNISEAVTRTIRVIDEQPPSFLSVDWPQGWQTQLPVTLTATVQDLGSGLAVDSGRLHVGDQNHVAAADNPADPWASQQLSVQLSDVEDGAHIVRFEVGDQLGQVQFSEEGQLLIDTTRPVPAIQALDLEGNPLTAVDGWLRGPILVEVSGEDATSGINALAYVLDDQPFVLYDEPFSVEGEGDHRVRYWAEDKAGNFSVSQFFDFSLDSSAPSVQLTMTGADETTVTLSWQGTDARSGIAAYEVETRLNEGDWQPQTLVDPLAAEATFATAEVDEVRVRGVDRVGNVGGWSTMWAEAMNETIYLPMVGR